MSENKSFEEKMISLEEIKKDLEKDNLSLDEAVKKFEEGMKIMQKRKLLFYWKGKKRILFNLMNKIK